MSAPEAFVLLTVPDATLTAPPDVKENDRDVYLMMSVNDTETPIDPAGTIQRKDEPGSRTYTFQKTDIFPADRVLTVPTDDSNPNLKEDLETFDSLLAQYGELRISNPTVPSRSASPNPAAEQDKSTATAPITYDGDLRGHLVAINKDTGEIIGQFDDNLIKIHEDPTMHEKGHENDAVYIEVPEDLSAAEEDANALALFLKAIPPGEEDWISTGATMISHAISQTTSLLMTTINFASSLYMTHSEPSAHHPSRAPAAAAAAITSSDGTAPETPKALVFLSSEETRKGLSNVHAMSSSAVAVSNKTVSIIDSMIRRAMGGKPKQNRLKAAAERATKSNSGSAVPSRSTTPTPEASTSRASLSAPPPYPGPPVESREKSEKSEKPPVPEIREPSSAPPPLPPRTVSGSPGAAALVPTAAPPPLPPRLRKRERAILGLDLILSTIDHETRRLMEHGAQTVGKVVEHKYGPEAGESSLHLANTAKNIGLVYIDVRGIGRRALLKRAGTEWVKRQIRNS